MKREKKKSPSDYPQMAFRISKEEKKQLLDLVSEVHRSANKKLASDEKRIKKNELIAEALFVGLRSLKKKHIG